MAGQAARAAQQERDRAAQASLELAQEEALVRKLLGVVRAANPAQFKMMMGPFRVAGSGVRPSLAGAQRRRISPGASHTAPS